MYSKQDEDCIIVVISKDDKTAEIHSASFALAKATVLKGRIGNYKTCLRDTNRNIGSISKNPRFFDIVACEKVYFYKTND